MSFALRLVYPKYWHTFEDAMVHMTTWLKHMKVHAFLTRIEQGAILLYTPVLRCSILAGSQWWQLDALWISHNILIIISLKVVLIVVKKACYELKESSVAAWMRSITTRLSENIFLLRTIPCGPIVDWSPKVLDTALLLEHNLSVSTPCLLPLLWLCLLYCSSLWHVTVVWTLTRCIRYVFHAW